MNPNPSRVATDPSTSACFSIPRFPTLTDCLLSSGYPYLCPMSAPPSWPRQDAPPGAYQLHPTPGLDRLRVQAPAHAFPSFNPGLLLYSQHLLAQQQAMAFPNRGVAHSHPGGGSPGNVGSYGHPHMFGAMAMGVPLPGMYAPTHPSTTPSTATAGMGMGGPQLPNVSLADVVAAATGGTGSFWGNWMARYAATGGIAAMNTRLNPNMNVEGMYSGVGPQSGGRACVYPGGPGPEDIRKQVGGYPGWQAHPHARAAGTRAMKAEPSQTTTSSLPSFAVDAGWGGAWGGGRRTGMASRGSSPSPGGSSEEER